MPTTNNTPSPTIAAGAPAPLLPATLPPVENVRMGLDTVQGMEALQRAGNLLANSTLVPEVYRRWTISKEDSTRVENPSGLANCVVALNMASRMGADPLMVMQNMNVIEGRPSWSSVFIIASINQCGRFSPLRFDLSPQGEETEAPYTYVEWEDNPNRPGKRRPVEKVGQMKIKHQSCRAWAIEKATGQRLDGPEVTIQMALDEGWIQKKGSKWRTMQEVMLRYRSASLFGKLYAPELLMGLQSAEEVEDIIDVEPIREEDSKPTRRTPKNVSTDNGWSLEAMGEFDALMDQAYVAFRDAGYKVEYDAFADPWKAKRGKADADETIAALRAAVEPLSKQAAASKPEPPVESKGTKAVPEGPKGVAVNQDDKLNAPRPWVDEGQN
jgi:hypothetical protein